MRDNTLYQHLLGIERPWTVSKECHSGGAQFANRNHVEIGLFVPKQKAFPNRKLLSPRGLDFVPSAH